MQSIENLEIQQILQAGSQEGAHIMPRIKIVFSDDPPYLILKFV